MPLAKAQISNAARPKGPTHVMLSDYAPKPYGPFGYRVNITSALEKCIKVALGSKRSIWIDPGFGTIEETFDLRGNEYFGLCIDGPNPSADIVWPSGDRSQQALISWNGADGADMFMFSRNQALRGITLMAEWGKHIRSGVVWDKAPGAGVLVAHDLTMERVGIWGNQAPGFGGLIDYCVLAGPTAGVFNMEFSVFRDCLFEWAEIAAYANQSTTGQSKYNLLERCGFGDSPIGLDVTTGSYHLFHCGFGRISDVAIKPAPTDTWLIDSTDTENCARFIDTSLSGSSIILKISNCRFSISDVLAADGAYIRILNPGPFEMENTSWEYAGTYLTTLPHIEIKNVVIPAVDGSVYTHNNYFMNDTPVRLGALSNPAFWNTVNDIWNNAGAITRIPASLNNVVV